MGPTKYGIGGTARSRVSAIVQAPPTNPQSGSGGPGILAGLGDTATRSLSIAPALAEVSDATTGRITLGMVNLTILVMLGFYWWTRSAQGGG